MELLSVYLLKIKFKQITKIGSTIITIITSPALENNCSHGTDETVIQLINNCKILNKK